ncbi:MAG TPA: hypothetical protein VFE53_16455 [Mucilaginibacter sp.]|jgi:hypothetical protein|nr:hypothetical protein [Mucilaginibacter sp.]
MKKSTIILIIVIVCLFVIPIIVLNLHKEPPVNAKLFTRTVPDELMNLFTADAKKQFDIIGTKKTSSGLPVSSVIYTCNNAEGVHGYIVELFKVGLKNNAPLGDIVLAAKAQIQPNAGAAFIKLREGGFDLKYKDGKPDSISKVNWTCDGDVLKLNYKSDSLLYYDVKFKHFTLKYDNGSTFTADKTAWFRQQTGKVIFLKRNRVLYTIFLSDVDVPEMKADTVLTLLNFKLPK